MRRSRLSLNHGSGPVRRVRLAILLVWRRNRLTPDERRMREERDAASAPLWQERIRAGEVFHWAIVREDAEGAGSGSTSTKSTS